MSKTTYNIQLKGYVGGWDFDRSDVDAVLAENEGKQVNVLIDSLGGNLATALSIAAAFKNHGKVSVHFVGMNASAATIASLGAALISIAKNAMYLVHKCSTAFFEWGSLNADQFRTLIADWYESQNDCDTSFLFPYAFGDDMPLKENNTMANRHANRRLEIYLVPGKKMLSQAKKGRIVF